VIEMLFCTDATPMGIQLTFPTCLLFGLGFMMCTIIASLVIMTMVEYPMLRILHLCFLPYLSHDVLVGKKYYRDLKAAQELEDQQSLPDGTKGTSSMTVKQQNLDQQQFQCLIDRSKTCRAAEKVG
jgi:hypothetical protein